MDERLLVVVGVIEDTQGRFLITRRSWDISHGGYWEFPGGKVDVGESPEAALLREMREELGLNVLQYELLGSVEHTYPHRAVKLLVYSVLEYAGVPNCCENQLDLTWIDFSAFEQFQFPAANGAILQLIQKVKSKK